MTHSFSSHQSLSLLLTLVCVMVGMSVQHGHEPIFGIAIDTIQGATVRANEHLDLNVEGNLNVESQQNRSSSRSHGQGASVGVSFGGDGNASGVNGGVNVSNGRGDSKQTVLTSLTSGGSANINVNGHTQLTGALIGTTDEANNDLHQLTFSTGSLEFIDLRNTQIGSNTRAGISTNVGLGHKSASDATSPTDPAPVSRTPR